MGAGPARAGRIKGTAIAEVVADVARLLETGRLDRGQLELRLEPADLALLDEKIQPALWYDNGCHARMTELLRDVEGGGHDGYVSGRGAATAERLLESGLYQQLQLASEVSDISDDPAALRRAIRLLLTLSGAMYDFGSWKLRPGDESSDEVFIDVHEAEALSEMNRLTAEGFIRRIAERLQRTTPAVDSWRLSADHVVYRIRLSGS